MHGIEALQQLKELLRFEMYEVCIPRETLLQCRWKKIYSNFKIELHFYNILNTLHGNLIRFEYYL